MRLRIFQNKVFRMIFLFFLMLFLVNPAQAYEPRGGEQIIIAQGEVVEDDLYAAANTIRVEGTIKGDLIAFGSLIVISETGVVEGDLLAAGQGVVVNGVVQDDARVAGAVISVGSSAKIGSDLVAAGYSIETATGSQIGQDAVAAGGQVSLAGETVRNVKVASGGLALNGKVGGDVNAEVGSAEDMPPFSPMSFMPQTPGMPAIPQVPGGLTVGSGAQVTGNLAYTAPKQINLPPGSIAGASTYTPSPQKIDPGKTKPQPATPAQQTGKWFLGLLRNLATLLLVGLLLSYFTPTLLQKGSQVIKEKPLPSLGWGILMYAGFFFLLFVIFVVVVILAVILGIITLGDLVGTVIGAGVVSVSSVALGFKVAASYIAKVLVGYLIGRLLFKRLKPDLFESRFWPAFIGILVFVILIAIPVLGSILNILAVLAGLGALYLTFRHWYKDRKSAIVV